MVDSKIQPTAEVGFVNAIFYDANRPSYPADAVEKLLQHLVNTSTARIVDLAAGSGKLTELLASRPEGYDILAVEPHTQMRAVLEAKELQHVTIIDGTAEHMPAVKSQCAEAVLIAQAFHWFANTTALQEIRRVLTPGGTLGLIWNEEDYNSRTEHKPATVWEATIRDIAWKYDDQQSRFRTVSWPAIFDTQPWFTVPLQSDVVVWTIWLEKRALWDRFRTLSFISVLENTELEDTEKRFLTALEGDDVEIDTKGRIAVHGRTLIYWTTAAENPAK